MIFYPSLSKLLPFIFLALATISLWLPSKKLTGVLASIWILSGLYFGLLDGLAVAAIFASSLALVYSLKVKVPWFKYLLHLLFIVIATLLMLHSVPGFESLLVFDAIKFSANSAPFTMSFYLDKPFLGVLILAVYGLGTNQLRPKSLAKNTLICLVPCFLILILAALFAGYVSFDLKLPSGSSYWIINNLVFVCVAEEAFFRRYIQAGLCEKLSSFKHGDKLAVLIASMIFGLAHFQGGLTYVALSTIAGVFYGLAFRLSKRIEAAILTHFGLNFLHFAFFSYPALSAKSI